MTLIRWNLLGWRLADAKANLTAMAARSGTFVGNYANNPLDFSKLPDSVFYKTTSTSATGIQFGDLVIRSPYRNRRPVIR